MIIFTMWVISLLAFIVPSTLWATIGEQSQVVRNLLYFMKSASMTEVVQPLSTSAVTMVVQLEARFHRFTLISRDKVPGFPCIVTILRSSFGQGTESELVVMGGG